MEAIYGASRSAPPSNLTIIPGKLRFWRLDSSRSIVMNATQARGRDSAACGLDRCNTEPLLETRLASKAVDRARPRGHGDCLHKNQRKAHESGRFRRVRAATKKSKAASTLKAPTLIDESHVCKTR